jgi:hypothetical protein
MNVICTNGTTIDTSKLTDKQAEIYEAMYNLYKLCEKYDVTVFARAIINSKKHFGISTVPKDKKRKHDDYMYLFDLMGEFASKTTEGALQLVCLEPGDDEPSS